MPRGRPLRPLSLSPNERDILQSMTRSRSLPHALVVRAQIVLLAAQRQSNTAIAKQLRLARPTVGLWRQRYLEQRIPGLYDELRPGGPRSIEDEQIAGLIRKTLNTKPKDGTHWTCRSIAEETQLSKSTVHRIWKAFGLQPHRQKHFKLSTDPCFVEKVRDIVGLYLNPPDKAMVLCVDEKSQIQALDRTQPPPWGSAMWRGSPTTTSATGPRPCSRPSTSPPARSSPNANGGTATRNSSSSSVTSTPVSRKTWSSIWSSTTTPRTSTPRCAAGSQRDPATTCTTPQPTPPGSTRWRSGSVSSPSAPSAAGLFAASPTWWPTLSALSEATTRTLAPSSGPPQPTRSSRRFSDFVKPSLGQDTSRRITNRPRPHPTARVVRGAVAGSRREGGVWGAGAGGLIKSSPEPRVLRILTA